MNSTSDFLPFAHSLADAARQVTLPLFRNNTPVHSKEDLSPVTDADRNCEKLLRELIAEKYPSHAIIGEEFGGTVTGDWVWILDPIDGTRSFISGSPLYCTLIGLLHKGKPFAGIIDMPALNERWSGCLFSEMQGASLENASGEKNVCKVSVCTSLDSAILATTTMNVAENNNNAALLRLCKRAGQVRLGGDASVFGCLASGFLDIAIDYEMAVHDYLPIVPIVQAAGGVITDWQGGELDVFTPKNIKDRITVIAAATPQLHKQALAVLQG